MNFGKFSAKAPVMLKKKSPNRIGHVTPLKRRKEYILDTCKNANESKRKNYVLDSIKIFRKMHVHKLATMKLTLIGQNLLLMGKEDLFLIRSLEKPPSHLVNTISYYYFS